MPNDATPLDRLHTLYYKEALWNCRQIEEAFERITTTIQQNDKQRREETTLGGEFDPDTYMIGAPEIQRDLVLIVIAASNVRKIIKPDTQRRSGETKAMQEVRQARYARFQPLLDGLDISEMYERDVRNALEHLDGELDEEVRAYERDGQSKHNGVVHNMGLGRDGLFDPPEGMLYLRAYLIKEQVFISSNHRLRIGKIAREARLIRERIEERTGVNGDAGSISPLSGSFKVF